MTLPEPKLGSEDFYKETYWNLNNIPFAPDSALRHVKVGINGINVPWMYFGSLFTVRCCARKNTNILSTIRTSPRVFTTADILLAQ